MLDKYGLGVINEGVEFTTKYLFSKYNTNDIQRQGWWISSSFENWSVNKLLVQNESYASCFQLTTMLRNGQMLHLGLPIETNKNNINV